MLEDVWLPWVVLLALISIKIFFQVFSQSENGLNIVKQGWPRVREVLPLFLGKIFSRDLSSFLPDERGPVRVLQLVHVHVERHGVRGREVLAEAGEGR